MVAVGCGGDDSGSQSRDLNPGGAESVEPADSADPDSEDVGWEAETSLVTDEGWEYLVRVRVEAPNPDADARCTQPAPPGETIVPFSVTFENGSDRKAPIPDAYVYLKASEDDSGVPGMMWERQGGCGPTTGGAVGQTIAADGEYSVSGVFNGVRESMVSSTFVVLRVGQCIAGCDSGSDLVLRPSRSTQSGSAPDETTAAAAKVPSADYLAEVEARGKPKVDGTAPVTELTTTDDVEGTGAEVEPGDTVTAHYVGVAASTGEEFDSSWDVGDPISFQLDGVIEGWSTGLVGMKEGGRRTLVIPADMAYGNGGPAPGDSLVFTVDLVAVD